MGLKSSPFYAQMASERIFSNENLKKYCEQKKMIMGSQDFPFTDVSQFRIIYIDDLLLHTLKELGISAHLQVIDFILWAVEISGVKLSRKKAKILQPVIKWLGHEYDSDKDSSGIPAERQNAFEKLRPPHSLAELNSRLEAFQYFQTYLPGLKKIRSALFSLAKSDHFYWTQLESEQFENIKALISAKIKNFHIQPEKPFFLGH